RGVPDRWYASIGLICWAAGLGVGFAYSELLAILGEASRSSAMFAMSIPGSVVALAWAIQGVATVEVRVRGVVTAFSRRRVSGSLVVMASAGTGALMSGAVGAMWGLACGNLVVALVLRR